MSCVWKEEKEFSNKEIAGILDRRNSGVEMWAAQRNNMRARTMVAAVRPEARKLGWGDWEGPRLPRGQSGLCCRGGSQRSRWLHPPVFYPPQAAASEIGMRELSSGLIEVTSEDQFGSRGGQREEKVGARQKGVKMTDVWFMMIMLLTDLNLKIRRSKLGSC